MSYISGEKQAPPQQVSFHSFRRTEFTFHELLLRNSHFSLPTTKEAWVTLSVPDRYPDIINETHSLKLEWRQKHLHGIFLLWKDKTGPTLQIRSTGKGKEFRVQIIQISSWLVLRQECNRQSSLRKQLRDDYSAVVAVKNKSKVQGNNWVFNLHTTWEFACMQMNNRIF